MASESPVTEEAKAKLGEGFNAIEELFVTYAQDVISRVVYDLNSQNEMHSSQGSALKRWMQENQKDYPIARYFEIKRNLSVSTSILVNDIKAYVRLCSKFHETHATFFDMSDEEKAYVSAHSVST